MLAGTSIVLALRHRYVTKRYRSIMYCSEISSCNCWHVSSASAVKFVLDTVSGTQVSSTKVVATVVSFGSHVLFLSVGVKSIMACVVHTKSNNKSNDEVGADNSDDSEYFSYLQR